MDLVLLLYLILLPFLKAYDVSILILMDLVLLHYAPNGMVWGVQSFNPYFNGSSTSTWGMNYEGVLINFVSILILMDLVLLLCMNAALDSYKAEFQSLF